MPQSRRVQTGTIVFGEVMGMTHLVRDTKYGTEYGYMDVFKEMNGEPLLVNVVLRDVDDTSF